MGADIGHVINVVIGKIIPWGNGYGTRVVWAGIVAEEQDVMNLYREYRCIAGIVDAMPEERMTRRMVRQKRGLFRAYYDRGHVDRVDKDHKIVNLSRTPAMDGVKEALVTGQIELPQDIDNVGEFYDQMMASTRIYDEDRQEFVWVEGSKADHYHHAMVYMNATRALVLSAM